MFEFKSGFMGMMSPPKLKLEIKHPKFHSDTIKLDWNDSIYIALNKMIQPVLLALRLSF